MRALRMNMLRAAGLALLVAHGTVVSADGGSEARAPGGVLFIGDGLDDQWLSIARNYLAGSDGRLYMDGLQVRSAAHLQMMEMERPTTPAFTPDSASSATSMATGHVTALGRVAVDAEGASHLETLVQAAAANGLRTGVVTNTRLSDATPAAFLAHVPDRRCETPDAMARFCPEWPLDGPQGGSIAEQIAGSPVDVLIGGGYRQFSAASPGRPGKAQTVREIAARKGFVVVNSLAAFDALPGGRRAIALLASDDLPPRWTGEPNRSAQPVPDMDAYHALKTDRCVDNPKFEGTPTLAEMTRSALERLSGPEGYFLMVESGLIDKESHRRRTCGAIGEIKQLDEAVEVAQRFAKNHGNTLLVVTSDHGQAAQLVAYPSYMIEYVEHFLRDSRPDDGALSPPGRLSLLETREGGRLAVNYGTNRAPLAEHTGGAVPVLMNEHGTGRVGALMFQKEIHRLVIEHLQLAVEKE